MPWILGARLQAIPLHPAYGRHPPVTVRLPQIRGQTQNLLFRGKSGVPAVPLCFAVEIEAEKRCLLCSDCPGSTARLARDCLQNGELRIGCSPHFQILSRDVPNKKSSPRTGSCYALPFGSMTSDSLDRAHNGKSNGKMPDLKWALRQPGPSLSSRNHGRSARRKIFF